MDTKIPVSNDHDLPLIMTIADLVKLLSISRYSFYENVLHAGEIKYFKVGRNYRFHRDDVLEFISRKKQYEMKRRGFDG